MSTARPRAVVLRIHAARRMLQRRILMGEIEHVLDHGDEIETYSDDTPFPSRLMLGAPSGRPLHVVAADDPAADITYVITVYEPDPTKWDAGFRRRKS